MLSVKYLVLPDIDRWRPLIERKLSLVMNADVQIDDISAKWTGLHPVLSLKQLSVTNHDGTNLLKIPELDGVISWSSIFLGAPDFVQLSIHDLSLTAFKRADGTLVLLGIELPPFDPGQVNHPLQVPAVSWILNQKLLELKNANLVWTDEVRPGRSLRISDINLTVQNGLLSHQILLTAQAPPELGGQVSAMMRMDQAFTQYVPALGRKLELFGQIDRFKPEALQEWFDLPLVAGTYGARAWVEFHNGQLGETTLDVVAQNANVSVGSSTFQAKQLKARLKGLLADILPQVESPLLVSSAGHSKGVHISGALQGARLTSQMFEPNRLDLGQVDVDATINILNLTGASVNFTKLAVKNSATAFSLQGSWHAGGVLGLGFADVTGLIEHLDANYLYRYLPTLVEKESRDWLHQAFLSGEFIQSKVKLAGDLSYFPFNDCGNFGQFRIEGQLKNIQLDYAPPTKLIAGWPVLEELNGAFKFERLGVDVNVQTGFFKSTGKDRVKISSATASIADLYYDPFIRLHVNTVGAGQSYIETIVQTPLAERFGEGLADAKLTGSLAVPVDLVVNLFRPEEIDASGHIAMDGESLELSKDLPLIENMSGRIDFSGETAKFTDVRAQMLDGKILVDGSFDHENGVVKVDGELGAAWVHKMIGASLQDLVTGDLQYKGVMKLNANGGIDVSLTSSLKGLSLKLPSPFGKSAEQDVPLIIKYVGTRKEADQRKSLFVSYGPRLKGRFERTSTKHGSPLFDKGVITYDRVGTLPSSGLAVEMTLPTVDADIWSSLLAPTEKSQKPPKVTSEQFLPPLTQVKLNAQHLVWGDVGLSDVDLKLEHKILPSSVWLANLNSQETGGTAEWVQGSASKIGKLTVRLSKVVYGSAAEVVKTDTDPDQIKPSAIDAALEDDRFSDIPSIDLTIDDLTMYGTKLGQFSLKGSSSERGKKWDIESLHVVNPYATLEASGVLRIPSAQRGVTLTSKLNISDLGGLTNYMGYPGHVKDGVGVLNADIDWRNFPWAFDYAGLSGKADINLKNGVFENLNSRSAKLLELLSVQSLQRLFSLNFKAGTVFQNGYPWNVISGKFAIKNGVVSTEDLTTSSPVAEIVLKGNSDLKERQWDMHADVKPIFDMSGTAVASGFVVNPFVGLGALVTQYVLRRPIENALTAQYKVTGPWDDPKLDPIGASPSAVGAEGAPR